MKASNNALIYSTLLLLLLSTSVNGCFIPLSNGYTPPEMCCWYSSNNCCGSLVSDLIFPRLKTALDAMYTVMGGSKCFYDVTSLLCSLCSPDNSKFITGQIFADTPAVTYRICSATCNHLFKNCNGISGLLGNWSNVLNEVQFCERLFNTYDSWTFEGEQVNLTLQIDTDPASTTCYNDVDPSTVQAAPCMTQYPNVPVSTATGDNTGTASTASSSTGGNTATGTGSTASTGGSSTTGGVTPNSTGLSRSTLAAIGIIAFIVIGGAVGAIIYYKRSGGFSRMGFSPFRSVKPITAIHPDDDDDEMGLTGGAIIN